MNILLVTYFFPPLNAVASLRTFAFARYLSLNGHKVTVLTAGKRPSDIDTEIDLENEKFEVVTTGNAAESRLPSSQPSISSWTKFKKRALDRVVGNMISSTDAWYLSARRIGMTLVKNRFFDVILSSAGPISSHFIAAELKGLSPRSAWIADYRDPWSGYFSVTQPCFPLNHLQNQLEKMLNNRADLLVVVSEPLKKMMLQRYQAPVVVVENGYFPEDVPGDKTQDILFTKRITITATGSIYLNKRDPAPFFEAVRQLAEEGRISANDVDIRFYGENTYRLEKQVRGSGISDLVQLLPAVSRAKSLAIQRASTALLFLEADDPVSRGYLTGKLFEYLVAGPPILAVGISGEHEAAKLVKLSNTGYVCGVDIGLIKDAILEIVDRASRQREWGVIEMFRRDRLVEKFEGYMKKCVDDIRRAGKE